jgi:hypothetical protein
MGEITAVAQIMSALRNVLHLGHGQWYRYLSSIVSAWAR